MGGLPVEKYPIYIYIFPVSWLGFSSYPLMSLVLNLFQLLSQSYFYLITQISGSWRISFSLSNIRNFPFRSDILSAICNWFLSGSPVLHFVLHSKPGKLSPHLSSDWLTFLGSASCGINTYLSRMPRVLSTLQPAATMFEWHYLMPGDTRSELN